MKRDKAQEAIALAVVAALNIEARKLEEAGVPDWLREQGNDVLADEIEFAIGPPEVVDALKAKKAAK
jgi:hypothetical protein